ncbi:glycyl-trna synthetase : Glycine--tRNA ligase OS=Pirellula staleyi (strain ATCC 27377 / DSM 6068 / ICPB 4128) GN=glyQS PE=3 SV=1: tRNA-synt_2b: HGTP_anticodon [Gemmataceae bacterium]|nr:glycyl-trna synthetase : Glycine--tRNA ligase OS=Pirellula staleyi (strain ATCC 27377 / DSM 6068 / ICPB 4128) GN=glyQS PE=3 SV=1: tRNA-synt_2b: HGTP_anticodon [Gemmataceae bacterium]VTU01294.1 glycyl-trna synthetase : Glycine--tRNA ligase OS=Pirellula staleyi (strain ATCC 27377 / DSM 6068 / ICPB 4128) GN=glyQS PE=3 SV=1: tRNA-synt_2b: HGTP_anticodon [Gemmataceae bacterium]
MPTKIDMAKFAKFCKDMGFIYQSSEIYGGINGFWDYGPLGVELKKNIKEAWWQDMVRNPPPGPDGQEIRMVGLDCSIIMNPKVWKASGHADGFSDPMIDCKVSKKRYRADQLSVVHSISAEFPKPRSDSPIDYAWAYPNGDEVAMKAAVKKFETLMKKEKVELTKAFKPLMSLGNPVEVLSRVMGPDAEEFGTLTEPRAFNLMFESHAGPIASEENKVYLRPETAQGIFANYRNVLDSTRLKLPFGIAQVGKAFRNEINPRNFTFRSREFEQMEIEFFCHPAESMKWYEYWRDLRKKWYSTLGVKSENLVPREQGKEELAHYSIGTTDIEYMFPFSDEPQELEGVAHRGDFDLKAHSAPPPKGSGNDKLNYFDEEKWNADSAGRSTNSFKEWLKTNPPAADVEKYQFTPHVIEPSAGADRFTLAVLCEAYTEDEVPDAKGNKETRVVMKFHPRLAPIKAAIFPLVNKDGMPEKAMALYRSLKPHFNVFFDDKGAVGRRYRRQDEAGTPFCITIDGDTLKDDTVTIRDRDTLKQERVPISQVKATIERALTPGV